MPHSLLNCLEHPVVLDVICMHIIPKYLIPPWVWCQRKMALCHSKFVCEYGPWCIISQSRNEDLPQSNPTVRAKHRLWNNSDLSVSLAWCKGLTCSLGNRCCSAQQVRLGPLSSLNGGRWYWNEILIFFFSVDILFTFSYSCHLSPYFFVHNFFLLDFLCVLLFVLVHSEEDLICNMSLPELSLPGLSLHPYILESFSHMCCLKQN